MPYIKSLSWNTQCEFSLLDWILTDPLILILREAKYSDYFVEKKHVSEDQMQPWRWHSNAPWRESWGVPLPWLGYHLWESHCCTHLWESPPLTGIAWFKNKPPPKGQPVTNDWMMQGNKGWAFSFRLGPLWRAIQLQSSLQGGLRPLACNPIVGQLLALPNSASFTSFRVQLEHSPITPLHAVLHLRLCFQGTQSKPPLL